MAFATGRDDESELIAGFRQDAVTHRDIVLSMFMLGNQTAMQHAAGRAMVGAVVVQQQQQQQQQQQPNYSIAHA